MKNLFVIYIGGDHEKSFIELHDMRFVVADTIEETYPALRKSWWGRPESLHLDAWGSLRYADGHEIHLKNTPPQDQGKKLYFVNLGGYDRTQFTELHKNVFVVAENPSKAKVKALKQILSWESHHRDYQFEIDDILDLHDILENENLFLHLVESSKEIPFTFTCKYVPISE